MSLTGDPDGPPYRAGISVFDVMAGLHATIGILAALHHRDADRRAASTSRSTCCPRRCPGWSTSPARTSPAAPCRSGWATRTRACSRTSRCRPRDGDLIVTAGNDGQFRKLVEVLGVPELADDPRFARNEDRTANREELRPLLVERLRHAHRDGVVRASSSPPACPCGPINTIDGGVAFAEELGLDPVVEVGDGDAPCRRCATRSRSPRPRPATTAAAGARRARRRDPRPGSKERDSEPTTCGSRPSLGTSDADEIRLLGQDLAADLMGKVGFGELAFWLVASGGPTPGEVRVFEAVLVALADHGFTPTAIAARLTYLSAPDSLQGALAAGLLGGGSRFLGVTEDCGRVPARRPRRRRRATADRRRRLGRARPGRRTAARARPGRFVPGLGHPVHKVRRPAHPGADRGSPRRRACAARTCGCSRRSAASTRRCSAGRCRSTAPASAAPRSPTSACRSSCCAASRCWPAPPGCSGSSPRSAAARSAWTSTSRSTATRSTSTRPVAAPTAPGPRRSSWLSSSRSSPRPTTRSTTAPARRPAPDRPPFADEWVRKIEAFRETLTAARPDVLVMVGSDHFHQLWLDNMPQFLVGKAPVLRRQLVQRGARVRPAADDAWRARRTCPRTSCATAWTPASTWPSATSCGSTTASPARSSRCGPRPTCRSCRSTPTSSPRRCRSRSGSSQLGPDDPASWSSRGRATSGSRSSAPATCPWSWAGRASSASTGPTRSSTARPSSGSPAATSRAAWPR